MVKFGQKANYLVHFKSFSFIPSYTLWVTPQDSAKWKTLLRYISVVSFLRVAFAVVKLKIFCTDLASIKWPRFFWGEGMFGPLLPKILFDLSEVLNRDSLPTRQTQCLKNPSKCWILAQMERTQSLRFCSILGHNLLLKNKKNV